MNCREGFEEISCNLCNEKDTKLLFTIPDKLLLDRKIFFNIVQCKRCQLIYINPRPSESVLADYYPEDYYAHQVSFTKGNFLTSSVTRAALNKFYNYTNLNLNGIKNYHILLSFLKKRQLENIPSYIKGGKILDIGCGSGAYLHKLKELGWETFGIEVSKKACEYARQISGLKIFCGGLLNVHFPDDYFDVVTIWHALEHLQDPLKILTEIKRILKNKGHLYIGVPNVDSLEARIFKGNWFHFDTPRHLYNFSEKTLRQILVKVGLKIQRIKHCGYGSYGFLGSFDNVLQNLHIRSRLRDNPIVSSIIKIPYLVLVFLRQSGCIELAVLKEDKKIGK